MKTYAEFLAECGATADEIKILDTPPARKAYEKQQAEADAAAKRAADAEKARTDYEASVKTWHEEKIAPEFTKIQAEAMASTAEAARYKAMLLKAQDQGLIDIAKNLGVKPEDLGAPTPSRPSAADAPPAFDASKFVSKEEINGIGEQL